MLELTVLLLCPTSTFTSTSTLYNISTLALQGDFRIHFTAHCIHSQYGCTEYLSIRMKVLQVTYYVDLIIRRIDQYTFGLFQPLSMSQFLCYATYTMYF